MPFYEYECASCKFYTEVMQKISEPPLEKCPSCGKKALKKLVSAPVFRLKGGGWYETDFKSDKEGKRNLAGADRDEPKSEDSKPAKADPKAAGAAAAAPAEPSGKAAETTAKAADGGGRASTSASKGRGSGGSSKPAARKPKPAPKAKARSPARKKGRR